VLALADDPTDYWSKALGFGVTEPVTRELMTEVVRFYELSGARLATVQLAPAALPEDWAEIAADLGLEQRASWVKLQRDLAVPGELPEVRTDLRIAPVAEDQLAEWARVLFSGFGMPADYDVMALSVDPAVFRRFAAWDGDRIVAAASLVVDGDAAGMFGAATLPEHRGRGAQSGLLAARLRAAAEAGVRWVSAETGVETPGSRNPSLHNLRRAGLADLYERPNWLWRAR
jgi:ribosomal protein S18 acetylase RimI-like enzyme